MKTNFISWTIFLSAILILLVSGCRENSSARKEISLNGEWEITRSNTSLAIPESFTSKIQVPGLVDMAIPPVETLDKVFYNSTRIIRDSSIMYNDALFWYRRSFVITGKETDMVQLKINKACYHTWVYVNGKLAGENVLNFTPTVIDIKPFLKETRTENELIIAVGSRNNLPDTVLNGSDHEKVNFIPGIYDDVKIILSDYPHIVNVQTVPDPGRSVVGVVAEIDPGKGKPGIIHYRIREKESGKVVAEGNAGKPVPAGRNISKIEFSASIEEPILWSPENPFLYDLELLTKSDRTVTRFGMRDFRACPDSAIFLLNGKPYYMRGTNVCIGRFFEDSARGVLPWERKWVTKLHQAFKYMHGNSIRYCIGFPPEFWYEIADSLGFLIQDEYPIWGADSRGKINNVNTTQIAHEYEQWMRERWNHPCVVIWDAQNETRSDSLAIAINKARHLDLSGRPWENGWSAPAGKSDAMEAHRYHFFPYYDALMHHRNPVIHKGILKDNLEFAKKPGGNNFTAYKGKDPLMNPIIINEYAWFWLNRDGSPTTLTKVIYTSMFPSADTPEKRLELYAKVLGMETEYWRSHRTVVGVLEFCGLGYSRSSPPIGQTSDHLIDVENVILEPNFVKYMRPAFNPVGIMLDFWDETIKPGTEISIPVRLVNDTYENWEGNINLSLSSESGTISNQVMSAKVPALCKSIYSQVIKFPATKGRYQISGEIIYQGENVKSIREFRID